ncbi:SMC-Scp complex subunit ScpB [Natranaerofaba carboxydovora]|uniref:SMC-Scp complex subunit ScpB n=1 Tax=Natranaerofaba carboxydovora TaxID=2742683 RepID=UPI001F12B18D|nr:SMC-Scp complex subunit ScpB [Natranaerofaba carboxydovora]UMZ73906.1 Segregation and condensation protein B [Natranaerofaba carboxydovora]
MQASKLKAIIEGILFTKAEPVTLNEISKILQKDIAVIREVIKDLNDDFSNDDNRGLQIIEVAGGYQLVTKSTLAPYMDRLYEKDSKKNKLSKAALETLAIIAYKEPVTKIEIEEIRGVKVDGVINSLLKKDLINTVGRKDVAGKPILFGVTKKFLEHFGLNSTKDLPKPEEIEEISKG